VDQPGGGVRGPVCTLTGDVPVGVDGVKSEIVQGKPFSTESHPKAKKRPAPQEPLIKEQLVV
jgi:hypothetical protein